MSLAQTLGINLFDLCGIWLWKNPKITIWVFILGCLLSRDLQTFNKSGPVPGTGGQTVPARLSDDGSPAGGCRVIENFFSLPPPPPITYVLATAYLRDSLSFPLLPWGSPRSAVPLVGYGSGCDKSWLLDQAHLLSWTLSGWKCVPWLHCGVKSVLPAQSEPESIHTQGAQDDKLDVRNPSPQGKPGGTTCWSVTCIPFI